MLDFGPISREEVRRLKRVEFERLAELGAFDDERVELLDGTIVAMSPADPPHSGLIERLTMLLVPRVLGRAVVRVQLPFAASDYSEPQPDLAIVPEGDAYRENPAFAHLVIEGANASLRKDRLLKAPLYAAAGVREYWIVNVREGCIEAFRESDGRQFLVAKKVIRGEAISPLAFPDVTLEVGEILGPVRP